MDPTYAFDTSLCRDASLATVLSECDGSQNDAQHILTVAKAASAQREAQRL